MISAKVVCDSVFRGDRLTTLEIELHRFVLPEFNTHRSLSRNFQSSRAVPVEKMIEQVRNNPAMPVHWGKNQSGMVAKEELDVKSQKWAKATWLNAARSAAEYAEYLNSIGTHKQIVNRILEPFMWTKGVVTATEKAWNAFFNLRLHKDAQPEIQALAFKIKEALHDSDPVEMQEGDWHLPYVNQDAYGNMFNGDVVDIETLYEVATPLLNTEEAVKVSASCCAQVSYRKLDDSLDKAIKIYDMLNLPNNGVYPDDPPHFSPTEHQVTFDIEAGKSLNGNFHSYGFIQYRKALEQGVEKELF